MWPTVKFDTPALGKCLIFLILADPQHHMSTSGYRRTGCTEKAETAGVPPRPKSYISMHRYLTLKERNKCILLFIPLGKFLNPFLAIKEQWAAGKRPGSYWGFNVLLKDTSTCNYRGSRGSP